MFKNRLIQTAACGVAMTLAASGAVAQDNSTRQRGTDSFELAPLVVEGSRVFGMPPSEVTGGYTVDATTVGTRTSTLLRGVPQSVSVVTHERLEDQQLDTLDEMATFTPGMRVLTNDAGRSSVYARGYEYNEFNIDGLPAPMTSINGSVPTLAAFDRVEILRGPSGLLNSTSELGGIVNMVLKRPTDELQGELTGRYGDFDQYYLLGDVSGPLMPGGDLRGRLVVADSDTDGFVDYNGNDSQTFYGALAYDFTPDTTGFLAFLRQQRDITVNNGLPTNANMSLLDVPASTFYGASWNSFEGKSNDFIGELKHDFAGGGQGRMAVRYADRDASCNYIFGGGAMQADGTVPVMGLGCDVDQTALSMDASFSQTFEWLANPGEWVVGVDHKRYETDTVRVHFSNSSENLHGFHNYPYVDIIAAKGNPAPTNAVLKETGLYSKLVVRPLSPLAVIGGLRLSRYRVENTEPGSATQKNGDDAKLTPYAGLVWDLGRHHSLYASYTEVFTPQTLADANGDLIRPREGREYEVGVKSSYLNGRFNTRLSLFDMTDRYHAAPTGGGNWVMLGSRQVKGIEAEISGSPVPQLDLIAGYTYLDMQIGDQVNGHGPSAIYMLMPEHSFKLWAKYTVPDGDMQGLSLGAGINALSGFESTQGVKAPGYAMVDAMIGYQFTDHLSGQLNVNNIFDKSYYNRVGSGGTFNFQGAPRNTVASISYQF